MLYVGVGEFVHAWQAHLELAAVEKRHHHCEFVLQGCGHAEHKVVDVLLEQRLRELELALVLGVKALVQVVQDLLKEFIVRVT